MEKIDLHMHSNLSDGELSQDELVNYAKENGIYKMAITDHDVISDVTDLASRHGVKIISGIEFNTSVRSLHMLGYGMTDIAGINEFMASVRAYNEDVCLEVIRLLQQDGFDVDYDSIVTYIESLGIPFGYMDKRKLVRYLIYRGYATGVLETYKNLIGMEAKYYVPNKKITPEELIELIRDFNGVSVLAHPNTINMNQEDLYNYIKYLKDNGLEGLEFHNGLMPNGVWVGFENLADELQMIKTVGSDFHFIGRERIGMNAPEEIFENLEEKILLKRVL